MDSPTDVVRTRIVKTTVRKPGHAPVEAFLVVCPCGYYKGPAGLILARAWMRVHVQDCPMRAQPEQEQTETR